MGWIGLSDREGTRFAAQGLARTATSPDLVDTSPDGLMVRGTLVMETRLPSTRTLEPLFLFEQDGTWPLHFAIHAIPGGGVGLVLGQGDGVVHQTLNHSQVSRTDTLRITYLWDAPRRWGKLVIERPQDEKPLLVDVPAPKPLRVRDARSLLHDGPLRYVSPEVFFLALSSGLEPIGPMPALLPSTPIETPDGYRKLSELRRGDMVLTEAGTAVPVLHKIKHTVPARGSWKPVRLRAPYFDLLQDIDVAPGLRMLLRGSEVEYLFGKEAVLIPSRHLNNGTAAYQPDCGPLVTYMHLLLPNHETVRAAGTNLESLFIGRLRRDRQQLALSLLGGLDRNTLPEHAKRAYQVLGSFDATVLAERRVA